MPTVTDYTALLSGSYWGGIEATATPTIVTYSFPTDPPAYLPSVQGFSGATAGTFKAFTGDEQAQARAALKEWSDASGIVFIEVPPGQGDITFQLVDFDTTSYSGDGGIGFYPFGDWNVFTRPSFQSDLDLSGDVFMNTRYSSDGVGGGTVNYGTLLHEIGHAIGLKHPTETVEDDASDPHTIHDQVLASDDPGLTVMAESGDGTPGGDVHLKQLDKDAAAFIYGAAGTGAVVTGDAGGANAIVSNWTWDAEALTLTQTGFAGDDTIRGSSVTDVIHGLEGDNRLFGLNGDDTLDAGSGNDFLDGGPGADTMAGGDGDDIYVVDNAADIVIETATGGTDTVYASAGYTLADNVERLQLFGGGLTGRGNALDNRIYGDGTYANTIYGMGGSDYIVGGKGNDTIDGGDGDDSLYGGAGTDTATYASASAGVTVSLAITGAQDTIGAGRDLLDGFENLFGSAFNDNLTGDGGNNYLRGLAGSDNITGGGGNDTLDGSGGYDRAIFADAANGVTVNLSLTGQQNTGWGMDSFVGIEAVQGSDYNDVLTGDAHNNELRGGLGNDTLVGGGGNDQLNGGAGTDTADYSSAGVGVHVDLSNAAAQNTQVGSDTLTSIENLLGGAFNDVLTGSSVANVLSGGAGIDKLDGGLGKDTLTGGAGNDKFYFTTTLGSANIDTITDFTAGQDKMFLDHNVFAGLTAGALAAGAYDTGAAASDADDRIIYNSATGALLFDRDGNGSAYAAVQFATLSTGLTTLSASSFQVA